MRSKKVLKNIIASLLYKFIAIISGFIIPRLIISSYGSDVNGLITSITQFLAYITLLESGVGPVIKAKLYKPIAEKNQREIENILYSSEKFFKTLAKVFVIYIFILCIFYPFIVSKNFDAAFTITLLIIIAISTIAEYAFGMTYRLFLQADQKTYIASYFQIMTIILNTIGIVILIKLGCGILMVKLLSSLLFVIRPLLQSIYVKKKYNFNLKNADKNYKLSQKWDGLSQHIAAVVHSNADVVILTLFSNVLEISVYSVYMLVINGVKSIVEAFTGGIDASFGDMIAKDEKKQLNINFSIYEFFFFTISTIVFGCTLVLVVPFIKLYMYGITDVNYIRPLFGILSVLAGFSHIIRMPYSSLTLAAGHFKETMKGAWVEAIVNIFISIILVFKFGLIGVAIGTLIAMIIRTIEFVKHTSQHILYRNPIISFKKILVSVGESLIIYCLFKFTTIISDGSYLQWITSSIIVFITSTIFVLFINICMYKNDFKKILKILKTNFRF